MRRILGEDGKEEKAQEEDEKNLLYNHRKYTLEMIITVPLKTIFSKRTCFLGSGCMGIPLFFCHASCLRHTHPFDIYGQLGKDTHAHPFHPMFFGALSMVTSKLTWNKPEYRSPQAFSCIPSPFFHSREIRLKKITKGKCSNRDVSFVHKLA